MHKGAILLNEDLPIGLQANIAAVLALSLGKSHPEIVGHNNTTKDNEELNGITQIPIPVLKAGPSILSRIFFETKDSDIFVTIFNNSALSTKNYNDYTSHLAETLSEKMEIHGVLLYGESSSVKKVTGNLPLLR